MSVMERTQTFIAKDPDLSSDFNIECLLYIFSLCEPLCPLTHLIQQSQGANGIMEVK